MRVNQKKLIGLLCVNDNSVTYFDSFGVKVSQNIGNKSIITNIYRVQAYDSIKCEYLCIGFIDFMSKGKSLFVHTNFSTLTDQEKNDKIISKYFQ